MNFKFTNMSEVIEDLFLVTYESFKDARGENFEGFDESLYHSEFSKSENWKNENPKFIVDSYSRSVEESLRGFHGDSETWKLVQCLQGSILLVVIDTRPNSSTFQKSKAFTIGENNKSQVLVPKGCVNAHLCLSKECLFQYKITHKYVPQDKQIHIKWNDPTYAINWPTTSPILSKRDL